jgi:Sec-independent protein translocase protein TatA
MADKIPNAFRWLGEGFLHIEKVTLDDAGKIARSVVHLASIAPGEIVKDVEHLMALGADRIAGLIKEGKAALMEVKAEVKGAVSASDKANVTQVMTESVASSAAISKLDSAKAEGTSDPAAKLPSPPVAGPTRS